MAQKEIFGLKPDTNRSRTDSQHACSRSAISPHDTCFFFLAEFKRRVEFSEPTPFDLSTIASFSSIV
jgi:hypothetical protein